MMLGYPVTSLSTVPPVQGRGRPPGQATARGRPMTEASVSFAGDLTDDPAPALRARHRPGHVSGGCAVGGSEGVVLMHDLADRAIA